MTNETDARDEDHMATEPNHDQALCLRCGQSSPVNSIVCHHCGATLRGAIPYQEFAFGKMTGNAIAEAGRGGASKVLLVGLWLLFVPAMVLYVVAVIDLLDWMQELGVNELVWVLPYLVGYTALACLFLALVYTSTQRFLRTRLVLPESTAPDGPYQVAASACTPPSVVTTCLSCGAAMGEANDECSACGWSFQE